MTCLVTFSAATSGGAVRANAKLVFVATGPAIRPAGGAVVPRDAIEAVANASGIGSVALHPGHYVLQMVTPLGLQAVEITVPAEETVDLWTLVDEVDIPLPPASLLLAQGYAAAAGGFASEAQGVLDRIDLGALDGAVAATGADRVQTGMDVVTAQIALGDVQTARDLAATYAGVVARATSVAGLTDPATLTAGDKGYVSGSGDDAVDGVYEVQLSTWVRTGNTGLAGKLSISAAPFVVGEPDRASAYLSVVDGDGFGNDILKENGLFLPEFNLAQDETGKLSVLDPDGFGYLLTPDVPPVTQAGVERTAAEIASQRPFKPISTPRAEVVAHRGLYGLADIPENSLDAVTAAAAARFDGVETDCMVTSDGEFVIVHDETLDRTFNLASDYSPVSDVSVIENTLADLRANYVLKSDNPVYRRPIPTLDEYLDECLRCGIKPYVEFKSLAFSTPSNVYSMSDIVIGKMGVEGCAFISFSSSLLDLVRVRHPKAELLYIHFPTASEAQIDAVAAQNGTLFLNQAIITRELVDYVHQRGIKIAAWTILPQHYNRMIRLGVDCVISQTVSPRLQNQKLLISTRGGHLWGGWSGFTTTGVVNADNTLSLDEGETVTLNSVLVPSAPLVAAWARAQFTGSLRGNVGATVLEAFDTTAVGQYAWLNLPVMYSGAAQQVQFTAGAGGAVIRLAEVAIIDIQ